MSDQALLRIFDPWLSRSPSSARQVSHGWRIAGCREPPELPAQPRGSRVQDCGGGRGERCRGCVPAAQAGLGAVRGGPSPAPQGAQGKRARERMLHSQMLDELRQDLSDRPMEVREDHGDGACTCACAGVLLMRARRRRAQAPPAATGVPGGQLYSSTAQEVCCLVHGWSCTLLTVSEPQAQACWRRVHPLRLPQSVCRRQCLLAHGLHRL